MRKAARVAGAAPATGRRGRARRAVTAFTAVVAAALAAPAPATAHGLVRRADLPIPEWLFAWAATGVLVVSFVALAAAWPRPRLEPVPWRPLPDAVSRVTGSGAVRVAGGATGVALLALGILAGLTGTQEATDNLAPTLILVVFWVGLAFASVLLGDVFSVLNPWLALGRLGGWAAGRAGWTPRIRRPYPESIGCRPAAAGLLAYAWLELASGWGEDPQRLAAAALAYTVMTLAAMAVFGADRWAQRGEAFSVYFGLLARMSVFERRNGRLGLRPPVAGLAGITAIPGTVAFVSVMIGSVTFDGLSQGATWQSLAVGLNELLLSAGLGIATAITLSSTLGMVACVALVGLFYRLGVAGARAAAAADTGRTADHAGGARAPGDAHAAGRSGARAVAVLERPAAHTAVTDAGVLSRAFVHALVPIAFAYVVAHYLTYLLFEGQAIAYLASDPLGRGWDLFGTASAGIDFGLVSQTTAWYVQAAAVVGGHVAGLALAHDRALVLLSDSRAAVRSQYWLLAVMVGFTTLALWLLAESA